MSYWMGAAVSKTNGTSREPEGTPREQLSSEQRTSVEKRLQRKRQERIRKRIIQTKP